METNIKLVFTPSERRGIYGKFVPVDCNCFIIINGKRLYSDDSYEDISFYLEMWEENGYYEWRLDNTIADNREDFELVRVLLLTLGTNLGDFIESHCKDIYQKAHDRKLNKNLNILEKTFETSN